MAISAGDAIIKIGGDSSDLDAELKKVDSSVKGTTDGISANFTVAGASIMAFGVIITAVLGAAVKQAADFEKGMREVNTMMLLSEQSFHSFSEEVRDFAFQMGVSAVAATEALYQAISKAVPKENVIEFMTIASQAAIGGVTDTTTAVNGLTSVINAFKIPLSEVQNVADVFFMTISKGGTTFDELAASLFNVAPMAAAAGVSFEEVAAALATITKQGTPTNVATTQLRQAIMAMTAPTLEQQKKLEALGLEMSVAAMETNGLAGQMDALYEATGGDLSMLRQLIGSVEGVQAVTQLAGDNAAMFAADLEAMGNAAGASTAAYEQMTKSFSVQFDMMKERLLGLAIMMGNVLLPPLTWVIKRVNEFILWLKTLNPVLLKVVTIGLAVAATFALLGGGIILLAGLSPLLIKAFASLSAITLPGLIKSISNLIKVTWALVASYLAVLAAQPWMWGMLVAGIGMITAGVILAQQYSDKATAGLDDTANAANNVSESLEIGQGALSSYASQVGSATSELGDLELATMGAADAQGALGEGIKSTTSAIIESASAARGLARALGDIMGYARTFPGGMTMEELGAFTGEGIAPSTITQYDEAGNVVFSGTVADWNRVKAARDIPQYEVPQYQHGTMLMEPTALWGLRSKSLLGIAGEAGPEPVGPTPQNMGQTIHNNFNIKELVVRQESDIDKVAEVLYRKQQSTYRGRGISA